MMRLKKIILMISFTCPLIFYAQQETVLGKTATKDHSITVFVHGTYPVRKLLQISPARFLIYCPQGLSLAKDLPTHYHFHKMAQGCVDLDENSYSLEQFYVFGWESERIYDTVRAQTAQKLVNSLQTLVVDYFKRYHVVPKIRLVGFSHGGNVVLHTANYLPLIVNNQQVEVEAWLFGTPVQKVNKHLVNSSNFRKVYSFYSKKDWMQRMDPQGLTHQHKNLKNIWSDRVFDATDRCIQVEFTVNGQSISHTYYRSIFKYFPLIQQQAEKKSQGMSFGFINVNLKK